MPYLTHMLHHYARSPTTAFVHENGPDQWHSEEETFFQRLNAHYLGHMRDSHPVLSQFSRMMVTLNSNVTRNWCLDQEKRRGSKCCCKWFATANCPLSREDCQRWEGAWNEGQTGQYEGRWNVNKSDRDITQWESWMQEAKRSARRSAREVAGRKLGLHSDEHTINHMMVKEMNDTLRYEYEKYYGNIDRGLYDITKEREAEINFEMRGWRRVPATPLNPDLHIIDEDRGRGNFGRDRDDIGLQGLNCTEEERLVLHMHDLDGLRRARQILVRLVPWRLLYFYQARGIVAGGIGSRRGKRRSGNGSVGHNGENISQVDSTITTTTTLTATTAADAATSNTATGPLMTTSDWIDPSELYPFSSGAAQFILPSGHYHVVAKQTLELLLVFAKDRCFDDYEVSRAFEWTWFQLYLHDIITLPSLELYHIICRIVPSNIDPNVMHPIAEGG